MSETPEQGPYPPGTRWQLTAAGGWCAPVSLPEFAARRGGIQWGTAEEYEAAQAALRQHMHATRWKRRRNLAKGWLTLRPLRDRIHAHIHRHCDEDY
jgi:hypothetical protein